MTTHKDVHMKGQYGFKALERNTSLESSKFCKSPEFELCGDQQNFLSERHGHTVCFIERLL